MRIILELSLLNIKKLYTCAGKVIDREDDIVMIQPSFSRMPDDILVENWREKDKKKAIEP